MVKSWWAACSALWPGTPAFHILMCDSNVNAGTNWECCTRGFMKKALNDFEAETGFHVIVGNAGGVTLSLDGTPLPPLGRSGEVVRDLVLPPVPRDSPSSGTAFTAPTR